MAATTPQYTSVDFEQKFNLSTKKLILRPILEWAPTFDEGDFEGINFKCVAPSTLVFHENDQFLTDADIPTPLADMLNTVTFEVDLPEFDSLIEMGGVYTITMTLHDGNGDAGVVEKKFTLAMPEQCSCEVPASNDGCAVLSTRIDCEKAKLIVVDRTAYLYNGVQSVDIVYEITTYSPPELLLAPIVSTIPYFSIIDIYSGTYKVVLSNTASYDFPDNTIVVVGYNTYSELAASCALDLCEANCAFDSLYDSWISTKASFPTKAIAIENKLQKASFIFLKIRNKQACGESVSDDVVELNKLLGTNCECNCPTHLTVSPSSLCCDIDLTIRGATDDITVTPTIVGNTFDFLIANKKIYLVTRDASNAGVLTITSIFTATQKEFKITLSYSALITALITAGVFDTIQPQIDALVAKDILLDAEDVALAAAIVAGDAILQAQLDALAVESWKTIGGGGTFVNGQSVPALSAAINPAANTSWTDAGGTSFKDTDIGMNLRARYNPQTNMIDLNGTITITAGVQNALITTMPTGYIPTRQQSIPSVCMDTSVGNFAHESYQPIFVYVRSNGQIRCAVNTALAAGTDYVICYINGSYPID